MLAWHSGGLSEPDRCRVIVATSAVKQGLGPYGVAAHLPVLDEQHQSKLDTRESEQHIKETLKYFDDL